MSTISGALPATYNATYSPTGAPQAATAASAATGDRGPGAASLANARLGGAWSGVGSVSSYGQLFGDASYVKNGSDPQLLQLLQQALERAPELQGTALAQHVQSGHVGEQDVQILQNFLQSKGYSVGSTGVDGKYGPRTHHALEGFLEGKPPDSARGATTAPAATRTPTATAAAATPPAAHDEAPAQGGAPAHHGPVGPGTKVRMIGDSHTAGTFGKELDHELRGTDAQVET